MDGVGGRRWWGKGPPISSDSVAGIISCKQFTCIHTADTNWKGSPFIDNLSLFYVLFYVCSQQGVRFGHYAFRVSFHVCSQQVVRYGHYAFRGLLPGMTQRNAVFLYDRPTNS